MTQTVRFLAIVLAALAGLAACSSGDSNLAPAPSSDPVPTSSPPDADTTPQAPTTTGSDPPTSPTYDEVETAVREAHTRFMTELAAIDEREVGPEARLPLIEELTTGAQKARMTEAIAERVENGNRLVSLGGYVSSIESVEIDRDRAFVEDCSLDRGELYSPQGDLLTPAAEYSILRTTVLVLVDDRWLVEDFWVGGDERCDVDA